MKRDIYEEQAGAGTGTANRPRTAQPASAKSGMDEEGMRKMREAGTPGPAHQALADLVGSWRAEVKCWSQPGGQPEISQATARVNWTLDGHFLQEEFHGNVMGQPFDGRMLMGYDNTKRKFNAVWVDSLHTSMSTSEGKGENNNKTITLEGKMDCPATGRKDMPVKQVLRVDNREKHTFELFSDGQKSMEITYTRQ